jgi:hypothetical protein
MINRSSIILCVSILSLNTDSFKSSRKKFLTFGQEVGKRFIFVPKSSVFSLFIFHRSGKDPSKNFFFIFILKIETLAKFKERIYFKFAP